MTKNVYFFASYSTRDRGRVAPIINDLEKEGFSFWIDYASLNAGDNWEKAIEQALKNAIGLVVFISASSVKSRYVQAEISAVASGQKVPIIPIILDRVDELPAQIRSIQWVDFTTDSYPQNLSKLKDALSYVINNYENQDLYSADLIREQVSNLAENQPKESTPSAVFLVHGHDNEFLKEAKDLLIRWGIEPIVLKEEENRQQTTPQNLFDKFHQHSARAKFAVVLLTDDDFGAAVREYNAEFQGDRVKDRALQYRARQNVILEMGFFYGRLGSERVFVIQKHSHGFYPRFERPSDLDGIMFDEVDSVGQWRDTLYKRLAAVGFQLKPK